jgi:hypothetical protein
MEYKTGYDTGTYETFEEGICPHQTRDRRGCAYRGPGPWDGACPYLNNPDIRCHIKNCIDETREAAEKRRIAAEVADPRNEHVGTREWAT